MAINRAPVMTLWAAIVAERLGYDRDEAATLGRAVAGLNAQSKGRRLGFFAEKSEPGERHGRATRPRAPEAVELLGRHVPIVRTAAGVRAQSDGAPDDPAAVHRYLAAKFGDALPAARAAMERLARSGTTAELAARAYALYEAFRPNVPAGAGGWGARGVLDLAAIEALAGSRGARAKRSPR